MIEEEKGPAGYRPTNRIRRLRQEKFWTLEDLSEASGIHVQTLIRLEHDRVAPRAQTVKKLARALNVAPTELVEL